MKPHDIFSMLFAFASGVCLANAMWLPVSGRAACFVGAAALIILGFAINLCGNDY